MSAGPQKPLKPRELGSLYPKAKTYDELQAERAAVRRLRRSWLPKHPALLIISIIVALAVSLLALATIAPYVIMFNIMLGVPLMMLLGIVWAMCLVGGIQKIRALVDQVTSDDGQSGAGASRGRR